MADGVVEPTLRDAVGAVMDNPDWLRLEGRTVVVLGAAAEMGPLRSLLRWGATVAAVDLPRPDLWTRLLDDARGQRRVGCWFPPPPGSSPLAQRAGVDLVHDLPTATGWVCGLDGSLVLGNYVYADGATNVRVSTAVDAMTRIVRLARPDTALSFLATPTDVFAVPGEVVDASTRAYAERRTSKLLRVPLRTLSGGRLLRRNYVPGEDPGINDSVVLQQGPNYLLAKRIQRWRATSARAQGATVSFKVAPPTRTRSVLKNRALAAAYAGAHRFGVEVFEPGTANTLMAALLVHDLVAGSPAPGAPVAGRGVRRGARRPLARGLRPAQRPGSRRPPRRGIRPPLTASSAPAWACERGIRWQARPGPRIPWFAFVGPTRHDGGHERHLVDAEATVRPPRPRRRRQPAHRRGEGDPGGHPPGLRRRRRPPRHAVVRAGRPARRA